MDKQLILILKQFLLMKVLKESDYITLHIPKLSDKAVIGDEEFEMMKDGVGIVNAARGGVIDEECINECLR